MSQIDEPAAAIAREHGTGEDAHRLLEEVAIRQSLANLRSFPFVADARKKWHPQDTGVPFFHSRWRIMVARRSEQYVTQPRTR